MPSIWIVILLHLSPTAFADQALDWVNARVGYQDHLKLKAGNLKKAYQKHDFAVVLKPRSEFLGYIGQDFQRLRMTFSTVSRSPKDRDTYLIKGQSEVRGNRCDFEGTLKIEQVREYAKLHTGVDDGDPSVKAQGIVIGRVELKENPSQKHVGTFKGKMIAEWYVDKDGKLQYDALEDFSDNYSNNQYVTTWTEYSKKVGKPANWGEYRIPYSDALDIGAGEFSADPKYKDKGW